jgi:hypothetical protein
MPMWIDALQQLQQARHYTLRLLDHVPEGDWFRLPAEGVTHVAWQVGHLAMAEYRLALERVRGSRAEDARLFPPAILAWYGKDSIPNPDPRHNLAPDVLRAALDRIHAQVLEELPAVPEADWSLPPHRPHPLFDTRLGSVAWCARHEMLHAGQIGLLRRLLGARPLW